MSFNNNPLPIGSSAITAAYAAASMNFPKKTRRGNIRTTKKREKKRKQAPKLSAPRKPLYDAAAGKTPEPTGQKIHAMG